MKPLVEAVGNAFLDLTERLDMDQAEELAALTAIDDGLTTVAAVMTKGLAEVKAEIANLQANLPPATSQVVDEKFLSINAHLAMLTRLATSLDDIVPDAPAATQPPDDDAFVAVGSTRFSDGELQTVESKAAAVAVWNEAHPDQPAV